MVVDEVGDRVERVLVREVELLTVVLFDMVMADDSLRVSEYKKKHMTVCDLSSWPGARGQ